jgi:hypothetical protein
VVEMPPLNRMALGVFVAGTMTVVGCADERNTCGACHLSRQCPRILMNHSEEGQLVSPSSQSLSNRMEG